MNDNFQLLKMIMRNHIMADKRIYEINMDLIETHVRNHSTLLESYSINQTQMIQELADEFSINSGRISILDGNYIKWVKDFRNNHGMPLWDEYKSYLSSKSFPIEELNSYTDDILDRCVDPRIKGSWDRRGMVVGNVQSGKTANFIGLINKAADAGYKLIIVIAGGTTSLRKQTQERIDQGFVGSDSTPGRSNRKYGVSEFSRTSRNIYSFTTMFTNKGEDGDLNRQSQERLNIPLGESPTVFVIKKNKSVLENMIDFLATNRNTTTDSGGWPILKNVPALIIDDEADSFSVNASKDINDIKTINRLIRVVLNLIDQSTFIGYTATPYANIFIPQDFNESLTTTVKGNDYLIGKDLFPEDFIINIKPPSNYIGAIQMFGHVDEVTGEEYEPLPLFRKLDLSEFGTQFPNVTKSNKEDLPNNIPNSLKNAIKSFFIVCAIRRVRGDEKKHNSMLIHVIQYVSWISRIARLVDETTTYFKNLVIGGDPDFIESLRKIYESDFVPTTKLVSENLDYQDSKVKLHEWKEVRNQLKKAVEKIEVTAVHGLRKSHEIEFEKYEDINYSMYENGANIIAVGGAKLSRGITLEGLSISYYLRNSKTYDSLMQMGRWFGYRNGYVDLCRLYTTSDVFDWFNHVTMATEEMRDEFDLMVAQRLIPKNYQLKVRNHSGLLSITSATKLYHSQEIYVSFSNSHLQTYCLSTKEDVIRNNYERYLSLFKGLAEPDSNNVYHGRHSIQYILFKDVNKDVLANFLDNFISETPKIVNSNLGEYILKQSQIKWNIVFRGSDENITELYIPDEKGIRTKYKTEVQSILLMSKNGQEFQINKTTRNPANAGEKFIRGENFNVIKNNLNTPADRFIDLPNSHKSKQGRAERKEGLLILYALDERVIDAKDNTPIIGFSLSIPTIENEVKASYRANIVVDSQTIEDSDDEDFEE